MIRRKTALVLAIASLVTVGGQVAAQGFGHDAGDTSPEAAKDMPPQREMGTAPREGGMGASPPERGMGMPREGMGAPPSDRGMDMPPGEGMGTPGPDEGL